MNSFNVPVQPPEVERVVFYDTGFWLTPVVLVSHQRRSCFHSSRGTGVCRRSPSYEP